MFKSRKQRKLEKEMKREREKQQGIAVAYLFAVFIFFILGMVAFPSVGSIVFFAAAILALPIKPIRALWSKFPIKGKWFRPVVLGIAFFLAIGLTPASVWEESDSASSKTSESTEVVSSKTDETTDELSNDTTEQTSSEEATTEELITTEEQTETEITTEIQTVDFDLASVPAYSGEPYVAINDNIPYFTEDELSEATTSYEKYSELDSLGRCGTCIASVGQDIMPTEERGSIGSIKPSGWQTVKYNGVVEGNYLYNRCHLLGYQLTGENANTKNLITGTRYMNVDGMLPFENMVADYIKETNNHVLYRVTPIFEGDNLLASGVLMEAKSVEDDGDGVLFNIYAYNVQPGVSIDYANGDSELDGTVVAQETENTTTSETTTATESTDVATTTENNETMVWIPSSGSKYHSRSSCSNMKNPRQVTESEAISMGYEPCKKCH